MINYILITNENGLPLFSVSYQCDSGFRCNDISHGVVKNPVLMSGFLNSLFLLGNELGGEIKHINLTNLDIFAQREGGIIGFVVTDATDGTTDHDDFRHRVKLITELFLRNYRSLISIDKAIDISQFYDFQLIIESHGLVDKDAKYKKNCIDCTYNKACPYRILSGDPKIPLTEKILAIPKTNPLKKLVQIIKGFMTYKPITRRDNTNTEFVSSIVVIDKKNREKIGMGFGCNHIPYRLLLKNEEEWIESLTVRFDNINHTLFESTVSFPAYPTDTAYGIINNDIWIVILEYTYENERQARKTLYQMNSQMIQAISGNKGEINSDDLLSLNREMTDYNCLNCTSLDKAKCFPDVFLHKFELIN